MGQQEFKQTEIGRIPKGWEVVRLGEILILEYGKGLPERERDEGEYPVIGSNGIVGHHNQALIKGPGIVIGRKGTIGAISLISTDFWPIDTTYYVKILKNVDLKWLFFALVKSNLPKLSLADVVPGLKRELVYALKLPLPPLPEQKKIAEILSTVDKAIEKVDSAIEKTERLKKGLMQELLTGRRNTVDGRQGRREFKQTEIGRIPKEWEIKELKEVVDINKESRDPTREFPDKQFFYIDIDSVENGRGIVRNAKAMVGKEAPSRARRLIHYNDVIMSTVRPYLKAFAIVPREYDNQICSTGFAVLTCKEKILPLYLLYTLFSKPVIEQCNKMMVGGQYPALNSSQVEKIKLPLPPLHEQKKIAEILSTVDKRLELLRKRKEKLERVKKGLMDDLLSGRKRVKVG